MPRITPTVGRVVHFFAHVDHPEPRAAIIVCVHDEYNVNLVVFNANGEPLSALDVPLVQDGDPMPAFARCEWMAYQKGQAAKTEALEAQLNEIPERNRLPSAAQIGDRVDLAASVTRIEFSDAKVFYTVQLADETEFCVDSVCITTRQPMKAAA